MDHLGVEVAYFFELYRAVLCFDDDVMQVAAAQLSYEIGYRTEGGSRHGSYHFFIFTMQCASDDQAILADEDCA